MAIRRLLSALSGIALTALPAIFLVAPAQEPMDAEALYVNNCAACHGYFGEGDGPVAPALRVTVPNLRTLSLRNDGVFPRDAVTAYIDGREVPAPHGSRTMPVWGDVFGWAEDEQTDPETLGMQRIDAVVDFVEALQYQ